VAAEEDARWLVGSYYVANFWDPSTMPRATGAQGQEYQAPPLLYEPLWDDYLIPTAVEVATISSTHPGIAGVHIDLEMYGTVLIYNEAHSFDDTTFQVWIDTLTDDGLRAQMLALPLTARLDELVDRGLLSEYLATLHAKAVEIGQRWRAAVDAVDPDTVLSLYLANIPACWQYRGFIEGAGRPDNPVIVVTYDPHTRPARASYVAQGIPMVSLGGPIVSHFPPTEFATVLDNCKEWTDGFWYFSHDEVSAIDHHPLQFGTREEYRTAIASVE